NDSCTDVSIDSIEIVQPYDVFHIAEIEVIERGTGNNVAQGKSASLSKGTTQPASNAVDGNTGTSVVSNTGGALTILSVDLGGTFDVETVRVTNHSASGNRLGGSAVYGYNGGTRVWSGIVWDTANNSVHEFAPCNPEGDSASSSGNCGLEGEYVQSGQTATRNDPLMRLPFGSGNTGMYGVAPNPASPLTSIINMDVTWTGQIKADHTEDYTFWVIVDNKVVIYIDGVQTVVDQTTGNWGNNAGNVSHVYQGIAPISMTAGEWRDIEIHFEDWGGESHFWLMWESASTPRGDIPTCNMQPY
ncbi:MAG: PA14 domain-containing protein, partial [Pirellulales bacterium]|nr:PA14 domain-containing protein [Pirellulales bacterium]